eukprot:TRINITY_DN80549_c0_g1_i1.p1 TRINITY_DN80549_c0_g1~~TRINITY_DN80549_c0_g1_i1.p1  ORF type:complete len:252 (+),score=79.66 TRINITY_DN80549_c0_g1_i1:64-819(+)
MKSAWWLLLAPLLSSELFCGCVELEHARHGHHKGHHHHHKKHHKKQEVERQDAAETADAAPAATEDTKAESAPAPVKVSTNTSKVPTISAVKLEDEEAAIVSKMRHLEKELADKEVKMEGGFQRGSLKVNGPVPDDFSERFVQAAAKAVPCDVNQIEVLENYPADREGSIVEIVFQAPKDITYAIEDQAADPESRLTKGQLYEFLTEKTDGESNTGSPGFAPEVALESPNDDPRKASAGTSQSSAFLGTTH